MTHALPTRKPLDTFGTGMVVLLCLCWSLQQIILKMAAHDVSPTLQLSLRSLIAAAILGAIVLRREGRKFLADGTLGSGLAVGAAFAAEFLLIGLSLEHTTASHSIVFVYTAPIFTALGMHATRPEERLNRWQWLGIAVAFAGIALAFLTKDAGTPSNAGPSLLGDGLALAAGVAWGLSTVMIRNTSLAETAADKTLFYQLLVAGVVLYVWSTASHEPTPVWSPLAYASLVYLVIVICLFSYLAWFWMLRKYLATQMSVLAFLAPILGVIFGAIILHEPLEPPFVAGSALTLVGILLVMRARR
jgi:drug/metabolite transporter (DMT)-like permease